MQISALLANRARDDPTSFSLKVPIMTLRARVYRVCVSDMSTRLTKKLLRVIAHQALQREQKKNLLAFVDPHREIEVLPEGLQTGHVKRRKRGARSDRDCI